MPVKNFVHTDGCTVTTHFSDTDPEMKGDYYDVTIDVFYAGKQYHAAYGDYYHDKGRSKADGFVDALTTLFGKRFVVLRVNVADREGYDD